MLLKILKYPNPLLRKKCREINEITPEIKRLALDMIETMNESKGVGLAAPQVGELKRLIIIQTGDNPLILVNPKILNKTKETETAEEGCLCLPDLFLNIKRAKGAEVEALNENGEVVRINDAGMAARILQHEIDHLDGILFIDKIGFWEKLKLKRKLNKTAN